MMGELTEVIAPLRGRWRIYSFARLFVTGGALIFILAAMTYALP